MLIRPEQVAALSRTQLRDFEERARDYLRKSHSGNPKVHDLDALMAAIRDGVERAARYEMSREIDVIRFLEFQLTLGRDFDLDSKFSECLCLDISAEERLDHLVERIRFEGMDHLG